MSYNLPKLSGDVSGAPGSNTVVNVNGVSIPASPSANQVLVATSSTVSIWQQLVNAQISSSAAIDVTKLATGTAGQLLLNNATPTPTWTTLSGDVTVSATGATIVHAISGSSPIVITPAVLQWTATTINPQITQARSISGAGQELDIIAQQAQAGSNANGGVLYLQSGAGDGAGTDGEIQIRDAAGNQIIRFQERAGNNGNLLFKAGDDGEVHISNGSYGFYNDNGANNLLLNVTHNTGTLNFGATMSAPGLAQDTQTSDVATTNLTIKTQAPFATATGNNRYSGSVVFDTPAPTNGGTNLAGTIGIGTYDFQLQDAFGMRFGFYQAADATDLALWLGGGITPSSSNYALLSDGNANTILNASSSGTVQLRVGSNQQLVIGSNGQLNFANATTSTSASAGSNGDVPAQVVGYLTILVNGTAQKIPYYAI